MNSSTIASLVEKFKNLTGELCQSAAVGGETWINHLTTGVKLCEQLPDQVDKSSQTLELLNLLEDCAVKIWNFSVSLKTKTTVPIQAHAKLRHMAVSMLQFCGLVLDTDNNLRRLVMMGLKTGRAWLDCGCADKADQVLTLTEKNIQKLRVRVKSITNGNSASMEEELRGLEQDTFTLLCHKAEAGVALSEPDEGLVNMMIAKDMLAKFPKEGGYLSMLCYNTGVELYQRKLYEKAITWLRESYGLGKGQRSVGPKNQARTLRLLANVYMETEAEGWDQNALNSVSLANTEHCHPAGLYLKLKILLMQKGSDDNLKQVGKQLIQLPDLTVELGLATLQLINQQKRISLMLWMMEELLKKFEKSQDIGKLLVINLEILIEADMKSEAKQFVEYCINAHHTGQPLDVTTRTRFHNIIWEQAALAHEGDAPQEALDWYNYSLSLYPQANTGDLTLAKLHRNRANCLLTLNITDKAKQALDDSLKYDPTCAHTQFLLYKLEATRNNDEEAYKAMKKLCELAENDSTDKTNLFSLIALAAQHSLECDRVDTASLALERLCRESQDKQQVLTALRCLIRLKLMAADSCNQSDTSTKDVKFSNLVQMGYETLLQVKENEGDKQALIENEANWFMKIAWNLALQKDEEPLVMKDLYNICYKLLCLMNQDANVITRQVTCLLMCAAACLQVVRIGQVETNQQKGILTECLEKLKECVELRTKLQETFLAPDAAGVVRKETDVLLLLYEFEARLYLQDPAVETVLERALKISGPDPKTFETLAAIANEPKAYNKSVSVRALKVAIRKHLLSAQPDILRCSKLFHRLVQQCVGGGSGQELPGRDEAWNIYMEIVDLIDTRAQGQYPEIEIVWLMTKAWNCGINFYSCNKYSEAEKWCGLGMRLLKYLDTYKAIYQDHMSNVYSDILAKVEQPPDKRPLAV